MNLRLLPLVGFAPSAWEHAHHGRLEPSDNKSAVLRAEAELWNKGILRSSSLCCFEFLGM